MLRFFDGFDHYSTTAQANSKGWTSVLNMPSTNVFGEPNGRNGGRVFRYVPSNTSGRITTTLDSQATWIVGMAWFVDRPSSTTQLVKFFDGATLHVDLRLGTDGKLFVTRNGTTLATEATASISTSQAWHHIQMKVVINDTTGVFTVVVDGATVINFSGDTRNAANSTADTIAIGQVSGGSWSNAPLVDDVWIADGQAGDISDLLADGDLRCAALLPDGAGNSTQWTPSAGSNFQNVDDNLTPDSDTTYNSDSTAGHIDLYTMANLPSSATTVYGVQQLAYVRKDDAGARTLRQVIRRSSTNYEGSDVALTDGYVYTIRLLLTDPSTSAAWTESGINAMEAGVKMQA